MNKAQIISNPKILGGKPVIAGTRISVELILDRISTGMSEKEIYESEVKNSKKPDNLKQWGELINERDYCIDYIDTLEAELAEYRKKL